MEEIVTNEQGGKGSRIKGKFTELPPIALIELSKVMGEGAERYPREDDGTPNWHRLSTLENLDHGGEHLANFLAERNKPDRDIKYLRHELSHFAARAVMALEIFLIDTKENK